MLKDYKSEPKNLQWHWSYSWRLPGGYLAISLGLHMFVGWRITDVELEPDLWNITTTPFLEFYTTNLMLIETPLLHLSTFSDLDIFRLYMPVFFLYEKDYRICYEADLHIKPTNFNTTLTAAPAECKGRKL